MPPNRIPTWPQHGPETGIGQGRSGDALGTLWGRSGTLREHSDTLGGILGLPDAAADDDRGDDDDAAQSNRILIENRAGPSGY